MNAEAPRPAWATARVHEKWTHGGDETRIGPFRLKNGWHGS
jgi:hypothetical protein